MIKWPEKKTINTALFGHLDGHNYDLGWNACLEACRKAYEQDSKECQHRWKSSSDWKIIFCAMCGKEHHDSRPKCAPCKGTGQLKHSTNPILIGSIECPHCKGTGIDDNKQLCNDEQEPKLVPLDEKEVKDVLLQNRVDLPTEKEIIIIFLKDTIKEMVSRFAQPKVTVSSVHEIWVWIRALKSGGNEDCSDEEIAQAIHDRMKERGE